MEQTLEEFNQLYQKFAVTPLDGSCEIVEIAPASPRDFKKLTISGVEGYVFPREFAGASTSFYSKASCQDPMTFNCDGMFFSEFEGRKCMFACELKSNFATQQLFHAREQVIGSLLRLKAQLSILQTKPEWELHGVVVSYAPTIAQLTGVNKLDGNEARFSRQLCSRHHLDIKGAKASSFYRPLAIPDFTIHYVAVPDFQTEYSIDLQTLIEL